MSNAIELIEVKDEATKAGITIDALTLVEGQISDLNAVDSGIAALTKSYGGVVYDVATTKGLDDAKSARAAVRDVRYKVQNIAKEIKKPLNDLKSQIDGAAEAIIDRILVIEKPIDDQIKAEETRKEEIKAAAKAAAEAAAAAIEAKFKPLRLELVQTIGKSSADLEAIKAEIEAIEIDLDSFGDRAGEATLLRSSTLVTLVQLIAAAKAGEEQAKQFAEQQAILARQQAELAEAQRKADEQAAALREHQARIQEAESRARQEREAAERAAAEAEERHARELREAEEKAERDAEAARQAEANRLAQVQRETEEIAQAEAQRIADEQAARELAAQQAAEAKLERVRNSAEFLLTTLKEIGAFTGIGPVDTDWRQLVVAIGNKARTAVEKVEGFEGADHD